MRELLDFFVRNSKWLVFILFVVFGCVLLFRNNPYQHHVYLTSANAVTAGVYGVSNGVTSYFNLRETNDDLNQRNAELQAQVLQLRQQLQDITDGEFSDSTVTTPESQYQFIVARVISNSISRHFNYITIDKGLADGVRPEMGVIDQNGVVGSVNVVSEHAARVISVLNPNFHVSCKLKGTDHFGSLSWDGGNPQVATLRDLPQHSVCKVGDTILTTGFSAVFPPDITVGYIANPGKGKKLSLHDMKILLSTDFTTLSTVQVVVNIHRDELKKLEESDDTVDKNIN